MFAALVTMSLAQGADAQTAEAMKQYPVVEGQWSAERANAWYDALPWLVGCNYYPATAINQIEMWQASTFDPETIDKELALAASIGMNTLRVYLHDMVWADDAKGLYGRMDQFLGICEKHGIRPFFVFFDDCHYPDPKLGKQPLPIKGWHNSGWVNSPARELAYRFADGTANEEEVANLKGYVQETMKRFKDDDRVLLWELYNEPGNGNTVTGEKGPIREKSNKLTYESWVWAREVNPSQPITSCSRGGRGEVNMAINRANSDVHSVHHYGNPEKFEEYILECKKTGRPVIMTEWLARTNNNCVATCLPIMKKYNVGAINWGFVSGKTGTIWPWTSRYGENEGKRETLRASGHVVHPGEPFPEPELWFHDLFRTDHTPYDPEEIRIFKELTGVK